MMGMRISCWMVGVVLAAGCTRAPRQGRPAEVAEGVGVRGERDDGLPELRATATAVELAGQRVLTLARGLVDAADVVGGPDGVQIPKVIAAAERLFAARARGRAATGPELAVVAEPSLRYRLIYALLVSTRHAGFARFRLQASDAPERSVDLELRNLFADGRNPRWIVILEKGKPIRIEATVQTIPVLPVLLADAAALHTWAVDARAKKAMAEGEPLAFAMDPELTLAEIMPALLAVARDDGGKPLFPIWLGYRP